MALSKINRVIPHGLYVNTIQSILAKRMSSMDSDQNHTNNCSLKRSQSLMNNNCNQLIRKNISLFDYNRKNQFNPELYSITDHEKPSKHPRKFNMKRGVSDLNLNKNQKLNISNYKRTKSETRINKFPEPISYLSDDLLKIDKTLKNILRVPRESDKKKTEKNLLFQDLCTKPSLHILQNYSQSHTRHIVYDSKNNAYYPAYTGTYQKIPTKSNLNLNNLMPIRESNTTHKSRTSADYEKRSNSKNNSQNILYKIIEDKFPKKYDSFKLKKDMITYDFNSRDEMNRRMRNLYEKKDIKLPFKIESPFEIVKSVGNLSAGSKLKSDEDTDNIIKKNMKPICFPPRRIKNKAMESRLMF